MTTYLFHRMHNGKEFFYPVDLSGDEEAIANVQSNPGTIRVTTPDGRIVWSLQ